MVLDDIATCPEITQAVVAQVDNQVTQVAPSLRTQRKVTLDGGRRGKWEDDGITTIARANGYGDRNEESGSEGSQRLRWCWMVDVEAGAGAGAERRWAEWGVVVASTEYPYLCD